AGTDVVEGHRCHVELVEADGGAELRERVDEAVVHPPVAPLAILDALLEGEDAALEREPGAVALDTGSSVGVLPADAVGPQGRRLDDVVVDGDDRRDVGERHDGHGRQTRTRSSLTEWAPTRSSTPRPSRWWARRPRRRSRRWRRRPRRPRPPSRHGAARARRNVPPFSTGPPMSSATTS